MTTDSRIIELGGIAAGATPGTAPVVARTYTHPAIGNRRVVRLVGVGAVAVEDSRLAAAGFAPEGSRSVGFARDAAIGFPAWPIAHDPANAGQALDLVVELRNAERRARNSAGDTRDHLTRLARRLARSVPHFVPTFLEEAGRIFIREGNPKMAASLFGKARQAERTHALPIDEERHRRVFLEFSLAGAVNAKELSAEARSLLERTTPREALERFLQLALDRVRGGLPPHTRLGSDIQLLVRAAGVDQDEVEQRVCAGLLASPTLGRATREFWKANLGFLTRVAVRRPEVRDALLELSPGNVESDDWVLFLEATGIADELRTGKRDAASWVRSYLAQYHSRQRSEYPRRLCGLIRGLPGLRGAPIHLTVEMRRLEPELLDALLEAGARVSITRTGHQDHLELDRWLEQPGRGELSFLASSEHADLVMRSLERRLRRGDAGTLLSHEGTRELAARWVESDSAPPELRSEVTRLIGHLGQPQGTGGDESGPTGPFERWEPSAKLAFSASPFGSNRRISRADIDAFAKALRGDGPAPLLDLSALCLPLTRPEVFLALAASPLVSRDQAGGAASLLASMLDNGLCSPRNVLYEFESRKDFSYLSARPGQEIVERETGRDLVLAARGHAPTTLLVFSQQGTAPDEVAGSPARIRATAGTVPGEAVVAAFQRLLARGAPPWDPARAARLAEGTGWSQAVSSLMLAALPDRRPYRDENPGFEKEIRELVGCTAAQLASARRFLIDLDTDLLVRLLVAGARDPQRVVEEGLDVEAMIAVWRSESGNRVLIPEEALAEADKAFRAPGGHELLRLARDEEVEPRMTSGMLWLAHHLERSNPLRPWLAGRFDALKTACAGRGHRFPLLPSEAESVFRALGLDPEGDTHHAGAWHLRRGRSGFDLHWHPAEITDWRAERDLVSGLPDRGIMRKQLMDVICVIEGLFDPIAADLRVLEPGYGFDPFVTAPDAVASAAASCCISEDAARYFLQLLALPGPTDRNIGTWNGWGRAQRSRAGAELLQRGLVVEAKRPRAGRSLFLPGGWQEEKAPSFPLEEWKAPVFATARLGALFGHGGPQLPRVPGGQLFRETWERYASGDVPGRETPGPR